MNQVRFLHLGISDLPVVFEMSRFKPKGLFFQQSTLSHFLKYQFSYVHDILRLIVPRSSLLTDSAFRINVF